MSEIIKSKVMDEVYVMTGHILLIFLVILCAYVSRIPDNIITNFQKITYKILGLFIIILLTSMYGLIHGILAALAFALIISRAHRKTEGFMEYIPALLFGDSDGTQVVTKSHRWMVERILGENPYIIRDKEVVTSAVQDYSEKSMGSSQSSR
jgi:hypothetical protein